MTKVGEHFTPPTLLYPRISLILITLEKKLMLRLLGLLVTAFQQSFMLFLFDFPQWNSLYLVLDYIFC